MIKSGKEKKLSGFSEETDVDAWVDLADEHEDLFGPMVGKCFRSERIRLCIDEKRAVYIENATSEAVGLAVFSSEMSTIEWLGVESDRRKVTVKNLQGLLP